jgi:tetratricopeptide (TPR) repeat protein
VHAFADGELTPPEADAFRLHLGTCAECQAELADILQLQGLGGRLAEEERLQAAQAAQASRPAQEPPSRAFQPRWSQRRRVMGAVLGGALAAVFAFAILRTPSTEVPGLDGAEALALAPTRSLEARLSYAGASAYRPYGVQRSGGERPAEKVPLKTLAKLEEAGDVHGLATAYLLGGERDQAAEHLRHAPARPDVDSDRAVVALSKGALEEALTLLDGVLEKQPAHPQALWNRALVLRELGLELAAARGFAQVAELKEPGWSDEARERQRALETQVQERQRKSQGAAATPSPEVEALLAELASAKQPAEARGHLLRGLGLARRLPDTTLELRLLRQLAGMTDSPALARAARQELTAREPRP